jgi:hypothetical protein
MFCAISKLEKSPQIKKITHSPPSETEKGREREEERKDVLQEYTHFSLAFVTSLHTALTLMFICRIYRYNAELTLEIICSIYRSNVAELTLESICSICRSNAELTLEIAPSTESEIILFLAYRKSFHIKVCFMKDFVFFVMYHICTIIFFEKKQ